MIRIHTIFSLLILIILPSFSFAKERITSFDAQIFIKPDRSIKVVETIEVQSEERQIKRGIFREIPQYYARKDGSQRFLPVRVESVLKDGERASWFVGDSDENMRIYIGKRFVNISMGLHTYQITYHIDNFIHDENSNAVFYWNVTGHFWNFQMDKVRTRIHFPSNFRENSLIEVQQITGVVKGSDQRKSQLSVIEENYIEFNSTAPFLPREGFTVRLDFVPDLLTPSAARSESFAGMTFKDTDRYYYPLIAVALFFLLLVISWYLYGIDLKNKVVIPRFEAPENISPALARFIYSDDCDTVGLTANLMRLAALRHIKIDFTNDHYSILKGERFDERSDLASDEAILLDSMMEKHDYFLFSQSKHKEVSKVVEAFDEKVENQRKSRFEIETNPLNLFVGLLNLALLYFLFDSFIFSVFGSLGIFVAANFIAGILVDYFQPRVAKHLSEPKSFGNILGISLLVNFFAVIILFMISFAFFNSRDFFQVFYIGSSWAQIDFLYSFGLLFALSVGKKIWNPLSSRRSRNNYEMYIYLAGLKKYLRAADNDEIKKLHPPEMNLGRFESLLPYAVALGCENEWFSEFDRVVSSLGDEESYRPSWYITGSGSNTPGSIGSSVMAAGMAASLSSSISSSAVDPSSSSSSGGGGGFSSGGGGGGGGGGGW